MINKEVLKKLFIDIVKKIGKNLLKKKARFEYVASIIIMNKVATVV